MSHHDRIKTVCNRFIDGEFDLVELQSRLETAIFPEELKDNELEILNDLEIIRFTQSEENHHQLALVVVNRLLRMLEDY
ncbi:hypothetical protein FLK61_31410 [Paenalkalicoccus suaedae]|uniref:Uncharacterized protein n=1 Tax=Paenalkalicoccus suaedae TaxID=2592382 RepID=A0A859FE90_9BACI|nr:hypothetical protein [Paenalkalicoccus suaedae]QKS71221.1 hypothetical protein FLK61_31410 [Paenalkalicoccus suaedae]